MGKDAMSKRIGILGGISHESTGSYYERIHRRYHELKQDYHYPEVLVYSLDFQKFTDYENHDREGYIAYILTGLRGLERAGAELIVMAANSPHSVYPEVATAVGTPVLSIAAAAVARAKELSLKRLLLLGIKHTMDADFYPREGAARGIDILVPSEEEKRIIDGIIFSELCLGRIEDASRRRLAEIVGRFEVDGVILGCTELPLILKDEDLPVAVLDTVEIHVEAVLKACLG
jgi:aspartate racemase